MKKNEVIELNKFTEFSDLKSCPFCGSEEYYNRCTVKGIVQLNMRFDGEETDNECMYDNLEYYGSQKVYCRQCNAYLGNQVTNKISGDALNAYVKIRNGEDESK